VSVIAIAMAFTLGVFTAVPGAQGADIRALFFDSWLGGIVVLVDEI
jgi:hypothetical protein